MNKNESNFECSICMEVAKGPVVTKCGHLFCWPCIFDWMETKKTSSYLGAPCPNCKNHITRENLIPIYVKDENANNTDRFKIPNRPKGQREGEQSNQNTSNAGSNANFVGGFGFFPLFGFNMTLNTGRNQYNQNGNSTQYGQNGNSNFNPNHFTFNNPFANANSMMRAALWHFFTLLIMLYFYSSV